MGEADVQRGAVAGIGRIRTVNVRAWVELARLSNAPTIISNGLVGAALGFASVMELNQPRGASAPSGLDEWLALGGIIIAMLLLYAGGMAMNDVVDAEIDRRERPNRPIPSGRVSRRAAAIFVACSFAAALAIAMCFGRPPLLLTLALIASVAGYNVLHKRFAPASLLMGLCRGLVYITVAAAITWPLHWPIAAPLAIASVSYVVLVTLIARSEVSAGRTSPMVMRLSFLLVPVALAPALWITPADWTLAVIAAFGMIGWLVLSQRHLIEQLPRPKSAVMAFLAAICLVDGYYLALLEQPVMMAVAWICFIVTVLGYRRISGT